MVDLVGLVDPSDLFHHCLDHLVGLVVLGDCKFSLDHLVLEDLQDLQDLVFLFHLVHLVYLDRLVLQ